MELTGKTVGFALTGSFCTFSKVMNEVSILKQKGLNIIPIMSQNAHGMDTRFGKAEDFVNQLESITGNKVIKTINEAEPIGPQNYLDALIIAPCTGNTLAKLANGITDTSVTMAAKATLRNKKPVVVAVSTNDGLSGSGKNLGLLLNTKLYYFVPLTQDDPIKKSNSLVADMSKISDTLEGALDGIQIQPIIF